MMTILILEETETGPTSLRDLGRADVILRKQEEGFKVLKHRRLPSGRIVEALHQLETQC